MTNLEIRAGRTMSEALEHLGDRLGIEEARSFATLIQQSAELGSSITEALRVYSDDMRHKRLSRAEEKAYSLPAKLAVPMMICIFPVLFVVILLPVFVRLHARQLLNRLARSATSSLEILRGHRRRRPGRRVSAENQPATERAGPLRNLLHRRAGAAQLAHDRCFRCPVLRPAAGCGCSAIGTIGSGARHARGLARWRLAAALARRRRRSHRRACFGLGARLDALGIRCVGVGLARAA